MKAKLKRKLEETGQGKDILPLVLSLVGFAIDEIFADKKVPHPWNVFRWAKFGKQCYRDGMRIKKELGE